MKEEKRGTVGMLLLMVVSVDVWIVMIFVNIMAWVPGLVSVVMMGIFDLGRKREGMKVSFGPNYVVGMATSLVVGLGIALPTWQLFLCVPMMPLIYVAAMDTYVHTTGK